MDLHVPVNEYLHYMPQIPQNDVKYFTSLLKMTFLIFV